MNGKNLEYYKGIKKDYDLDKLSTKGAKLFEIVNKYQLYSKKAKTFYLKLLYKLGFIITLYLAKKESVSALKNKRTPK